MALLQALRVFQIPREISQSAISAGRGRNKMHFIKYGRRRIQLQLGQFAAPTILEVQSSNPLQLKMNSQLPELLSNNPRDGLMTTYRPKCTSDFRSPAQSNRNLSWRSMWGLDIRKTLWWCQISIYKISVSEQYTFKQKDLDRKIGFAWVSQQHTKSDNMQRKREM